MDIKPDSLLERAEYLQECSARDAFDYLSFAELMTDYKLGKINSILSLNEFVVNYSVLVTMHGTELDVENYAINSRTIRELISNFRACTTVGCPEVFGNKRMRPKTKE